MFAYALLLLSVSDASVLFSPVVPGSFERARSLLSPATPSSFSTLADALFRLWRFDIVLHFFAFSSSRAPTCCGFPFRLRFPFCAWTPGRFMWHCFWLTGVYYTVWAASLLRLGS